jgi:hypothetical protein
MKRSMRPGLETLEDRSLMSASAILSNGVLTITGDANAANTALVTQSTGMGPTTTTVSLDGQKSTFTSPVQKIVYNGGNLGDTFSNETAVSATITVGNGANYITDTGAASKIVAGNGANNIHASGKDTISVGSGANVIYDVAAPSNITLGAHSASTVDHVITTNGSTVTGAGANDVVVKYGAMGRQAGAGNLVLSNGVLYFTANNKGDNFTLNQVGTNLVATYNLNDGTGKHTATYNASDVKFLAGLGGAGNDNFVNDTKVGDSFVAGKTGYDMILGGTGFNLLVGGATGGIVGGFGSYNDVSMAGPYGILIGNPTAGSFDLFRTLSAAEATINTGSSDPTIKLYQ